MQILFIFDLSVIVQFHRITCMLDVQIIESKEVKDENEDQTLQAPSLVSHLVCS